MPDPRSFGHYVLMKDKILFVETPEEALEIWSRYRQEGVESTRRVGPRGYDRRAALVGLEIPHAVALFVEDTFGFPLAEGALRREYGLAASGKVSEDARGRFFLELASRLPMEFRAPHEELCEAELEEMMRASEAASGASIEERYRARYPGLMREGFGWRKRA